jgi:hypothetical protein
MLVLLVIFEYAQSWFSRTILNENTIKLRSHMDSALDGRTTYKTTDESREGEMQNTEQKAAKSNVIRPLLSIPPYIPDSRELPSHNVASPPYAVIDSTYQQQDFEVGRPIHGPSVPPLHHNYLNGS